MPFRVIARTILQLGAELISSDAIAFYELIKNAFDARSKRVNIRVFVHIPYDAQRDLRQAFEMYQESIKSGITEEEIQGLREQMLSSIDPAAPEGPAIKQAITEATSFHHLQDLLEEANYILIEDSGEGMTLDELNNVYLTIGTRSRLVQREQQWHRNQVVDKLAEHSPPILGEKGVGRLSAMRLGQRLRVRTTKRGEMQWNELEIDWSQFSHKSDALLEDIDIAPYLGQSKDDPAYSGTTLRISALTSNWSEAKLLDIATQEFSRLTDPFVRAPRYPISLRYNNNIVVIPQFDRILFERAHAVVEAQLAFSNEGEPRLSGRVEYRLQHREKMFSLQGAHLTSATKVSLEILKALGPFNMKLYWYNRKILTAVEGIGDLKQVRKLVAQWAGGLMVFRDGFRVNPYGSPDDDWLDLDRVALASQGYKVNRRQIIGKVDISSIHNPQLVDQTNREGLRDSDEKHALIGLLQYIVGTEFKTFLDAVDKEIQAKEPVSFDELEDRVELQERQVQQALNTLVQKHPELLENTSLISNINSSITRIRELMREAKELATSYEAGRSQMLNLAGLGLMVEILAHELNRSTNYTLTTLRTRNSANVSSDTESLFTTLESQLKTLQKRLQILDPLSTAGRQRKETFDLIAWLKEILQTHEAQFKRHNIRVRFDVQPPGKNGVLRITAVKGMIVQVIENLISNSVYWLKQQQKLESFFVPEITVVCDTQVMEVSFTDNGPGIDPARLDDVFQPFVTTKPPGEGKGLGLFISREIARYNGGDLYLLNRQTVHPHTCNTFVFVINRKRNE